MWIARDKDGTLFLYDDVPVKREDYFIEQVGHKYLGIDASLFPEVTWENSPQKINTKLVKNFKEVFIEKACQWLEKELFEVYDNNDLTLDKPKYIASSSYDFKYDLINAFKKAMNDEI